MSTLNDDDLTALLDETAQSYDVPPQGPAGVLGGLAAPTPQVPLLRRRWVQLSAAACVTLTAVLLAASTSGGSSTAGQSTVAVGAAEGRATSAGQDVRSLPAAAVPAGPGLAPVPAPNPVGGFVGDGAQSRVVKSGTIALVAPDHKVSAVLDAVLAAAKAQGGYVASSSTDEYGDSPNGEVTIRVPVDRFEPLVSQVRRIAEVRTASTSGRDVTAEYADQEAQLRTLRATRDRFLQILTRANTISEILSVQQRVDGVSGQIDRLEAARKLLAGQSDLSTLTVQVAEKHDVTLLTTPPRGGLTQALRDAKDGFVTGVEAIVRHSGRALVWLLSLALVALALRLGWRVARRRLV